MLLPNHNRPDISHRSTIKRADICSQISLTRAIVFTRCELVKELTINGLPEDQLPDWVCLIESESSRNSSAIGGPNKNGSYDYGLFQINDRYWCIPGKLGGDCNMDCNDFIDDDITDDIKCTKKIYKRHGFNAWAGWRKRCENHTLPDLSMCNNTLSTC
ncbi:uncharacterized protein CBL_14450 [Carabus blaptoides fortunei]